MSSYELIFWSCAALVIYPYVIYPLLLALLSRLRARPVHRGSGPGSRSVSFVVAARNEQHAIEGRLQELIGLLEKAGVQGEILLVSDGSSDDTATIVRLYTKETVRLIELSQSVGKAEAISRGATQARNDVLVFADVRQRWSDDALPLLLENFADPAVGAVSGDLEIHAGPGAIAGVGVYWKFEKWLRQQESRLGCQVGVTGAISAVRRELFRPIPPGTLLDDVYWPLQVACQGYRVVHDHRAKAFDHLPDRAKDEMRRKVRTLAGNFQLIALAPTLLLPWRNPVWWQLVSRKLLRLVVPWALLGLLVSAALLDGWMYRAALFVQLGAYGLALFGLWGGSALVRRLGPAGKVLSAAASFLVLNTAAFLAFWVWVSGRAGRSWSKVAYQKPVALPLTQPEVLARHEARL